MCAQVYNLEPPTDGKVVFHTSYGDIDIELWPKEAPLACRNFIQVGRTAAILDVLLSIYNTCSGSLRSKATTTRRSFIELFQSS
jgi:cyclophilin family peptidyl-prolyl cis-trans isomerase